jgi:PadR family transcriptional regulator, regulatory protein PadR
MLEPAILVALTSETAHGYDLRAAVEELTSGFLVADPGGLYRALRRMEDDGLVVSTWTDGEHGPQRRTYEITEDGREMLLSWVERLTARRAALDGLLHGIGRIERRQTPLQTMAEPGSTTNDEESHDAPR